MLSGAAMAADSLRLTVGLRMLALSCLACFFVLARASRLLVDYQRWAAQTTKNAVQPFCIDASASGRQGSCRPAPAQPMSITVLLLAQRRAEL